MADKDHLVYLIDDEENVVSSLKSGLEQEGFVVRPFVDPKEALKALKTEVPSVVVTDILMGDLDGIGLIKKMKRISPELSFVVITAYASLDSAIEALRLGVIDYLIKPFRMNELVSAIQRAMSQKRLIPITGEKWKLGERYQFKNLMSRDPRMVETFSMVSKVAKTDATVLIMGESGTGKEMMARSIHYNSKRKGNPFVSVNCAALPETLLESELFGYEKGAFTGATATKQGLFEVAKEGTFFLDEVGDIPLALQPKLLRVLQERVITHLGGVREIPIDIRLIAATSRNLPDDIKKGRFREDFFYRLNVVPVLMLPLRERLDDIVLFADYFLRYYATRHGSNKNFRIDEKGAVCLKSYAWPGNIRELENLMERIVTLEEGELITSTVIEKYVGKNDFSLDKRESINLSDTSNLTKAVEDFEKQMILEALKQSKGNKFKAARHLGITRQNLQYKLKKYEIS